MSPSLLHPSFSSSSFQIIDPFMSPHTFPPHLFTSFFHSFSSSPSLSLYIRPPSPPIHPSAFRTSFIFFTHPSFFHHCFTKMPTVNDYLRATNLHSFLSPSYLPRPPTIPLLPTPTLSLPPLHNLLNPSHLFTPPPSPISSSHPPSSHSPTYQLFHFPPIPHQKAVNLNSQWPMSIL